MVRVDHGRFSCSAMLGTLLIAFGCAPPPPLPPDDFVVCWEVLLPADNEGNLAAQIIGTPPDDMYGLPPADVPSAGTLELFGTHDAMGRISSLEGFAYSDPDGWRTRVAFVDSLTAGAPQTDNTSRTIRAELPGLFLWITGYADSSLQVAYTEEMESTARKCVSNSRASFRPGRPRSR